MKWVHTADLHGNNRLPGELEYSKQMLLDLGRLCLENGCRHLIVDGDVVDQRHGLNLPVMLALHEGFSAVRSMGVTTIIVPGNHDKPDPLRPYYSPLGLLAGVVTVLFEPRIVEGDDYVLVLMPWFEPVTFRRLVHEFSLRVANIPKRRILASHVSLNEGRVSPSNTVTQPIRVEDLHPEVYHHIFLGDYHAHQAIPGFEHVQYLGAPRGYTHGDYNNLGPWLFNTETGENTLLQLPTRYPKFKRWAISATTDLPLPGYDARDRNQIHCPLDLMGTVKALYPEAEPKPVEGEVKIEGSRLEVKEDILTPQAIGHKWVELQGLPKHYTQLVDYYLAEALKP